MDGSYRCHGTAQVRSRLTGYSQHDPVVEYKRESFDMFEDMITSIQQDTVKMLLHVRKQNVVVEREQVAKPTGHPTAKMGLKSP